MIEDQCPCLVEQMAPNAPTSILDLLRPNTPRLRLSDARGLGAMLTPRQVSAMHDVENVERCLNAGMSADGAMFSAFANAVARVEPTQRAEALAG